MCKGAQRRKRQPGFLTPLRYWLHPNFKNYDKVRGRQLFPAWISTTVWVVKSDWLHGTKLFYTQTQKGRGNGKGKIALTEYLWCATNFSGTGFRPYLLFRPLSMFTISSSEMRKLRHREKSFEGDQTVISRCPLHPKLISPPQSVWLFINKW